jgi:ethanolamine utilization protein EutA
LTTGDLDIVQLTSAGVDVGSATCQVVFSRVTMRQDGTRFLPVAREVTYESPVRLTPYVSGTAIDVPTLAGFVREQFALAGLAPDEIQCGALILTGTALDRSNARLAAGVLAGHSGRFVAVTAGDSLEAVLAAHGSGAVRASLDAGTDVLSIDIGGGTTKLALCRGGAVVSTAALDVGARLLVRDAGGVVIRLEAAAQRIARLAVLAGDSPAGCRLAAGEPADDALLDAMTAFMAEQVLISARLLPGPALLLRGGELDRGDRPAIVFSGGVAEYLDDPGHPDGPGDFGDLGKRLAEEIGRRVRGLGARTIAARSGIRATALGAALFTTQLSGTTIFVSSPGLLPARDVPVAVPHWPAGLLDPDVISDSVVRAARTAGLDDPATLSAGPLGIAVGWTGSATFERLNALAAGILDGVARLAARPALLVVVCDDDVGRLLGRRMVDLSPGLALVCLDGVNLSDLDYLDVGKVTRPAGPVPVTVKSLVFGKG